jgi:glutamyl-tRNA reductase
LIVIFGINHRTAPLPVRERFAFPKDRLAEGLQRLLPETGLREGMILSTCNRVEIYGEGDRASAEAIAPFLARFHGRAEDEIAPFVFKLEGEEAVRHALRVATSLDSMVLGESQILGQVKAAYREAELAGALGPALASLRSRVIVAARRARSETTIGENAVSVSHVAVELARKIFGSLDGRRVLIVGAGKMSGLAARQLVRGGARATVLGGRTFERAAELAAGLGGHAVPFEQLRVELARADIVISSTGAPGFVILREDVRAARSGSRRPLFLIDIALPRDVDPAVRDLESVFLYDLDDLKSVSGSNLRERAREAARVESIVEQELAEQLGWQRAREVVPLVVEMRRRGDEIRRAELEKALKRVGPLTPQQAEAVEAATAAIVKKLLHPPTVQLKEFAREGRSDNVDLACRMLGLGHA